MAQGRIIGTRPASGRGDFRENMDWLNSHRDQFKGQWVALRDGGLVDSDKSLISLQDRLTDRADGTLFVWVQED